MHFNWDINLTTLLALAGGVLHIVKTFRNKMKELEKGLEDIKTLKQIIAALPCKHEECKIK